MANAGGQSWGEMSNRRRAGILFGALVLGALTAGVIYLAWFATLPTFTKPDFWESMLENRPIMGFVRLAIMAGAVYVVVSVVALISRGQWLSRAGPFQVQDAVRKVSAETEELRGKLKEAESALEETRNQLAATTGQRDEAATRLAEMRQIAQDALNGWKRSSGP